MMTRAIRLGNLKDSPPSRTLARFNRNSQVHEHLSAGCSAFPLSLYDALLYCRGRSPTPAAAV
jgi:hypothetical protein